MTTPHKHHDCIVAWAKGAQIQFREPNGVEWIFVSRPQWFESYEYRVKPEPKPDRIFYKYIHTGGSTYARESETDSGNSTYIGAKGSLPNLKLTLDGETGQLKSAEVI